MAPAGFLLLHTIMVIIVLLGYSNILKRSGKNKTTHQNSVLIVGIMLLIWTLYIKGLTASGILYSFDLPPRFPIFLIVPAFLFIGIFLYQNRHSEILHTVPISWTIYFQSFRIVIELLFLAAVAEGILHEEVTFHGYNMDFIFALTAPVAGFLVFQKKLISLSALLIWNYVGLAVIVSIISLFMTTIFFPSLWGSTTTLAPPGLVTFGPMLVAGFLMPLAVFIHFLSIIRLRKEVLDLKTKN